MTDEQIRALAKKIFEVVEGDLRDRRGIKHEWGSIEDHIQHEIRVDNWRNIENVLKGALTVAPVPVGSRSDG